MKTIIEFSNKEEAQEALNMISAYLGTAAPAAVVTKEAPKEEPKEEKKVPVTRAKDEVKKDGPKKPAKPVKPEPEEEEEEKAEEEEEASSGSEIDLAELTQIAKDAVARTDRGTVKDVISEYGEKLSAVAEEDYEALAAKLKELE